MSGSQPPSIGLDARAAELKEKLLKSRGQGRAKTAQPKTDDANTNPNATAGAVPKAPSSGPSVSEETKLPEVTPLEAPEPPISRSLLADEDDIAALISSISGTVTEPSEVSSSNPSSGDLQKKMPAAQVATPPTAPASGTYTARPKPAPKISIPGVEAMKSQSKQSTQQATRPPAESSTKQSSQTPPKQPSKPLAQASTASAKNPVEKGDTIRKDVGSMVPPAPKAPATGTACKTTERENTKNDNSFVEKTASDRYISQLSKTSSANSHQETARERTDPTFTKPPPTRTRADSKNYPKRMASPPMGPPPVVRSPVVPHDQQITPTTYLVSAARAAANDMRNDRSEATSLDDAFSRLLNQVPDLKDFLEMTDYYDVETRTRKLDRFRRLKALAAERLRLEEEERQLMKEAELELQRSTVARFTSVVSSAASDGETTSLPTPVTPAPTSIGTHEIKETPPANGTKRAREEDGSQDRQEKAPRLEGALPPRVKEMDDRSRLDDRYREDDRRDARDLHRDSRSRLDDGPRSPPPRRRYRDEDDYDARHRHDSHKDDDRRYRDSESRSAYPKRIDLGSKGDSRFFIVKSFNQENVRICMEENLWTTQLQNGEILAEAFAKCKNVILFFSINGSKAFQGYARMASAPSPDTPRPSFVKGLHWNTSGAFRVQWLSKTAVPFFRIGHLKNACNEYRPVLVGKDGQEIDGECGPKLLAQMEEIAVAESPGWKEGGGGDYAAWSDGHYAKRRDGY
ncbi:YT521-B-like domain-containing protein [Chaetomium sp. MPI-CAGE-AT-0009]|nr:YT521-B-like domain-containing protein [Chaetomium sp. MPI-CAGE-AT-0009]